MEREHVNNRRIQKDENETSISKAVTETMPKLEPAQERAEKMVSEA